MKKLQIWGWFISAFLKKHKKILFVGISLGIIFAIFTIWVLPYIPRPNPVKRVGIVGQYQSQNMPEFITSKIGQGLTSILDDGQPAPALVEEWKVLDEGCENEEDKGCTYIFTLRDNLFWQDGTPVTTQSLNYSFKDVETKVIDDKTVQFTLKSPFTPFPTLLSEPALKKGYIGTGEYKLRKVKERSGYLESVILEGPKDTYVVKFYPSITTIKTAFMLGEVDEMINLFKNPFEFEDLWNESVEVMSTTNTNQYIALFLNMDDPLFYSETDQSGRKNFRQALAYATVKPTDSSRVYGPISNTCWAYNPDLKPYNYDPQRARELLEKSQGGGSVNSVSLRLSTTQAFLPQAEEIKRNWEETLGIKVEVQVINTVPENFQVLLASQEIPPDPDQYSLWHSTQTKRFTHYQSPRVDKLLEVARQEQDPEKREEYYYDFQKFFVEESPVIFISYPQTYTVKRKSVIKPITQALLQLGRN